MLKDGKRYPRKPSKLGSSKRKDITESPKAIENIQTKYRKIPYSIRLNLEHEKFTENKYFSVPMPQDAKSHKIHHVTGLNLTNYAQS